MAGNGEARGGPGTSGDPAVGLCACCGQASLQRSGRGSSFWRCRRADSEPGYRRYPPLPVTRCAGHELGEPQRKDAR